MQWLPLGDRRPPEVTDENLATVMAALEHHRVPAFLVRTESLTRRCIGILAERRIDALRALTSSASPGGPAQNTYVRWVGPQGAGSPVVPLSDVDVEQVASEASWLRICRPYATPGDGLRLGFDRACEVEFWTRDEEGLWHAPRGNVASEVLGEDELATASVEVGGRPYPVPEVFSRRMIDDITFPIDVVYSWVDGEDPTWQAKRRSWQPDDVIGAGSSAASTSDRRFRSRDELKYSLRGLQMFAPWVRHVYLITDDQVPTWLDEQAEGLTVVSHRDLFRGAALPTFSSRVISSFLHRIDGLSERFLYLNDDVFLGRPVSPHTFFTPAGQARVFPGRTRRRLGPPTPAWTMQDHATRNVRCLLERDFGVVATRAMRHAPVALLRSELASLEARYPDEYARTRSNRFRHASDIEPVLLFHYYAQIVGAGIASPLAARYVNLGNSAEGTKLDTLLHERRTDAFCLNDTVSGGEPVPDRRLQEFMESYFPVRSTFERRGGVLDHGGRTASRRGSGEGAGR